MASKTESSNDIKNILVQELFNENNIGSCGPNLLDRQFFLEKRTNISNEIKDVPYLVPQECFHPKVAVAIDFLYQFVMNLDNAPIKGRRLVDSTILKKEAQRILRFTKYYFEYTQSYAGTDNKGNELLSIYTSDYFSNVNIDDEDSINRFLNEIFNYFITQITVTKTRREIGSATINFKDVRNYRNNTSICALTNHALSMFYQLLTPMLPIKIWARGRLYNNYYFPIFDGYIVTVNTKDSAGFFEIEVACKDVLEIARFSSEMISPGLIVVGELQKIDTLNLQSMPFYEHDHMEVFQKLFIGGNLEYDPSGRRTYYDSFVDANGNVIKKVFVDGVGFVDRDAVTKTKIARAIWGGIKRSFAVVTKFPAALSSLLAGCNTPSTNTDKSENVQGVNMQAIDSFNFYTNVAANDASAPDKATMLEEYDAIPQNYFSIERMLHDVSHTKNPRRVFAWGAEVTPYRIFQNRTIQDFTSDFSSRFDILKQIAEMTYYDFYVDGAGTVHYHPFRFLNDYLSYDAIYIKAGEMKYTKHQDTWPGVYVVGPEEILNNSPVVNSEEMITFLRLTGKDITITDQPVELLGANDGLVGTAVHREYMSRFGYRRGVDENPLFNFNPSLDPAAKDSKTSDLTFLDMAAAALIQYKNAELYNTTCSIIFRPEMEVARPIYFAEDSTVFYINSVTHTIDIGGGATTVVNASFGRKDYDPPPDLESFILMQEGIYRNGEANVDPSTFISQLPTRKWENFLNDKAEKAYKLAYNQLNVAPSEQPYERAADDYTHNARFLKQ